MTSKEFVIWLKGFTEGVHEFNITPKQWDILKEKLAEVNDQTYSFGTPNGTVLMGSPNIISSPNILTFSSGSSTGTATYPMPGTTVTYTTNGAPNWYTTTIANEKTLLND
jgi:hypothetical protein